MTAKCRTASIAAKALLCSLRAHRAFADDADFSVILFEASDAAESITRLVSFALELATAPGITAPAPDESGRMKFKGLAGQIHGVDFPVWKREEGTR